ncbi:hypothetical protein COUCH_34015 [Couchioplanes caeruleus]|uniref:hypothetical protein n=1 Tax=Couchioplanes caeruleus TaxID=56438 RepID=UPI0020C0AA5A|nr:hypothetical protein [Couchioplanes caeruleus]UQU63941.1 hypothetical protein COUCH_34015 [Couchioplanes caeruleus]
MSRWDAGTVLALSMWTLWTTVALALLGTRRAGPVLSMGFVVLGVVLWAGSDVTWRAYLEGALIAQIALAATGIRDRTARRRLALAAVVSVPGVVWLAVTGGPRYWVPPLVGVALVALVGGVAMAVSSRSARWTPSKPLRRPTASPSAPARAAGPGVVESAPAGADVTPWRSSVLTEGLQGDERRSSRPEPGPSLPFVEERCSAVPERSAGVPMVDERRSSRPVPGVVGPVQPTPHRTRPSARDRSFPVALERPAHLQVQAMLGASVNVVGMGRICGPGTVRVHDSRTVVVGDDVTVDLRTHLRVKRVELSLGALRERCAQALDDLVRGGSVARFQRRLRAILGRPGPDGSQERLPVKAHHRVEVYDCAYVHLGNGTRTDIEKRVVFDISVLPLEDLLLRDARLCGLLAKTLRDRTADRAVRAAELVDREADRDLAAFLRHALAVAGRADDRDLIRGARGDVDDASVRGLFGTARVRDAEVAVVGAGNELRSRVELSRPGFDRTRLHDRLVDLRRDRDLSRTDRGPSRTNAWPARSGPGADRTDRERGGADTYHGELGVRTTSPVFDNPEVDRERRRIQRGRDDMRGTDRPGRDAGGLGGRSL